ncbi:MAG: extracellular solute-binding protein [Cyanobacteria bacterium P01_F01_bin.150]
MESFARQIRRLSWRKLLTLLLCLQVLGLLGWGLIWPQSPPIELTFVTSESEVAPWKAVIADFESSHPHIRVNLVSDPEFESPDQREAIYRADFQAENARYDLVYMDSVWTAQFADRLLDLAPKAKQMNRSFLDGFLTSEMQVGQYNSGLYRLPMRSDIGILYYRKDLLERAGQSLPSADGAIRFDELDRLITAVKNQTSADIGYLWQGESYEGLTANFIETLGGLGGEWITPEDNQAFPDMDSTLEATKTLRRLIQQGLSPRFTTNSTEQDTLAVFKQGNALFLRGWPYFWSDLQNSNLQDKVAIAPPFSFSDRPGVGCRGGWGFGIPKNGTHPDEAWEAIQYFTSEAAQKTFVINSGFLPSRRSLFTDRDIVAKYPLMPLMLDYLEDFSIFRPQLSQYNAVSKILQRALAKSLTSDDPAVIEPSIREAREETQKLFR